MNARLALLSKELVSASKKHDLLDSLRGLLRQSFELGRRGALQEKQARAQGYADGYLKALTDVGVANERELLTLVQEVRRGAFGPATASLSSSDDETFAA